MAEERKVEITRTTKETDIRLTLDIDGRGDSLIDTGIPFFDHMLTAFSKHGFFDLNLQATGDLEVDYHHTVEDVGIVLGQAVKKAIGNKAGINRYGSFIIPMDDSLSTVALDLCNRSYLVYNVPLPTFFIRDFNAALFKEFFQGFANEAAANVHVNLQYGEETHHIVESVFKAFGRALDFATTKDPRLGDSLPSTKGVLN